MSALFPWIHIQQLRMSNLLAVTLSYVTLTCTTINLTSVVDHIQTDFSLAIEVKNTQMLKQS